MRTSISDFVLLGCVVCREDSLQLLVGDLDRLSLQQVHCKMQGMFGSAPLSRRSLTTSLPTCLGDEFHRLVVGDGLFVAMELKVGGTYEGLHF